jgi:uncharacterized protein YndB with AHSA1/START domain
MATNTIRIHRVLRATPERIYRAFLDADAMTKWLPPNGFTGKVHQLDAKVGGAYKMSFTNFATGHSHSFGGTYLELVPNERIRHTDRFDDPNLPGELPVTITIKRVSVGTELNIVQEGVPEVPFAGRIYLQDRPGMFGTAVCHRRLCSTGPPELRARARITSHSAVGFQDLRCGLRAT